ncbi:universal stress protein [Oxalobacter sp. OttesenSCG-928-P03]|nr:universal stress protein [Oxalobacter sp. OttesenSCG-928-P03]
MLEIKRILVASDMSESSALAETRAAKLCRRFGVEELELVNVQDTGFVDMLGQILGAGKKSEELVSEQITRDFEPVRKRISDEFGIRTSLTVLFGRPSVEIARHADRVDASLIVVGAKQPGLGKKFFLGNTPDRLLHITPVPLLIVRQEPSSSYQNVLIPVDFSENSKYAVKVAMKMMLPAGRKTFLHAYDIPNEGLMRYANVSADLINNFRNEARVRAENEMTQLIASLDSDNRVSQSIQYGSALRIIEDYVNMNNPDLIIMGKQGKSHFENLLLGSTTRNTVNETSCDILVVPLKREVTMPAG